MPMVDYRTGVSSLGMEQTASTYICDRPGCEREADYGNYCEEHDHLRQQEEFERGQPRPEEESMEEKTHWFVLTHEYGDRSAYHVCGITASAETAKAWSLSEDNFVYKLEPGNFASPINGHPRWNPDRSGHAVHS